MVGEGLNEVAINSENGNEIVCVHEKYYRPSEVDSLLGDSTKAKKFSWEPKISFNNLVEEMMEYDMNIANVEKENKRFLFLQRWRNMKPSCRLIIGATGLIGRSLSKSFIDENTFFISKNNKKEKINKNHYFIDINNKREVTLFFKKLNARYKKVIIFFLAVEISVEDSIKKPEISFLKSLQGFSNVISNANQKSKLIICSSGSLYDSRKKTYFKETDSLFPPSSYSASKYAIEGLALSYFESFGIDVRIARIFSVYGEDMKRFFIYDLIKKIKNNPNAITLNGSGKQFRDYLHVNDIVKGLKIINSKGSQEKYTIYVVARKLN